MMIRCRNVLEKDLLIKHKAIVEENDLDFEVRKQYTIANMTFLCQLFEHSYNDLFVYENWYNIEEKHLEKGMDGFNNKVRELLFLKEKYCPLKLQELDYEVFLHAYAL